ncbi:glycine cleavage system protein H [Ammoniphilus resinae]|uniref:Glycine cleavage system H protein n=1 Tax=Ammoniphilus resinae TaxID=861532 RepID=A0ABS4GRB6_9BACL|nr:glycine cleavage system protein H [Ammoniphilus resinae]MBP1932818.1 glycine cleavage system H protein [Ammoniphilus resinae]
MTEKRFSREHIWIEKIGSRTYRIGLTPFAIERLGEVIAVELPVKGERVQAGQAIGTVETAKTVTDLYAPLNGLVSEINLRLMEEPDLLNRNPLDQGWVAVLESSDSAALWSNEEYDTFVKGESK